MEHHTHTMGTQLVRYWYRALLAWRGGCGPFFLAQRPYGKKLMTAGFAAQRGEPEKAPEVRGDAGNVFCGDALQFQVAANSAMRVQKRAKRHQARVKSRHAGFAAPRQDASETEEIVHRRPAPGTPGIRTMTNRAACRAGSDRFSPRKA